MKALSKDARGFIEGVANYIRHDRRGKGVLPKVQSLFTKVTAAAKKERIACVSTVVPPTKEEQTAIQKIVERLLGHEVTCTFIIDKGMLGGMKIQIADWIVDTSLSSQLTNLSETLSYET